jgi:hypothetical protein
MTQPSPSPRMDGKLLQARLQSAATGQLAVACRAYENRRRFEIEKNLIWKFLLRYQKKIRGEDDNLRRTLNRRYVETSFTPNYAVEDKELPTEAE